MTVEKRLENKVALVTGAARGIGLAAAVQLAQDGADILAFDLAGSDWAALKTAVSQQDRKIVIVEGDVGKTEDWEAGLAIARSSFDEIHVLFNNAGISGPARPFWDYPDSDFDNVMRVNCRGVFLGMKMCLPLMRRSGGSIINMSSVSGLGGGQLTIAYNASKHAVIGMTKVGAVELAPFNIRVNAICPAMTDTAMMQGLETGKSESDILALRSRFTDMIPLGRYADPAELAAVVAFLASEQSSFITGAAIPVDGGLKAR